MVVAFLYLTLIGKLFPSQIVVVRELSPACQLSYNSAEVHHYLFPKNMYITILLVNKVNEEE